MGFLDFIKHRNTSKQPTVAPKPQERAPGNAREFFRGEAAGEKAQQKPINRLPADAQSDLESIRAARDKTLWPQGSQGVTVPAGAPDAMPNAAPMRQKREGQELSAPSLSPTDGHKGSPATDKAPEKEPEKASEQPKTLPRPRASHER